MKEANVHEIAQDSKERNTRFGYKPKEKKSDNKGYLKKSKNRVYYRID